MRFANSAIAAAALAVLSGCVSAPPPQDRAANAPPGVTAIPELRADSFGRYARNSTLRLRSITCDGVVTGSGFALSEHTLITNRHVVDGASGLQVSTWDGRDIDVTIETIGVDNDLAVIHTTTELPVTVVAGQDPAVGDEVFAVGYPEGGRLTITSGTVVDLLDGTYFGEVGATVRTTAAVLHGNSGGPMFDANGELAAVVFAIEDDTAMSLAIPASQLDALLDGTSADAPEEPDCA